MCYNNIIKLCGNADNYKALVFYFPFLFPKASEKSGAFDFTCLRGDFMPKLTEKQKRFCEEYLIDLNATQAAVRAGYAEKNAGKIGHELLEKTRISEYLSSLMQKRSERTGITADKVLSELEKVAFAETDISGKEKIKALELLGKHLGLFSDQLKPSGEQELPALWKALEEGGKN